MSQQEVPVILIATANPATASPLTNLAGEYDAIKHELFHVVENNCCTIEYIADANAEKLIAAFDKYKGRLIGIHYAGHANSEVLQLKSNIPGQNLALEIANMQKESVKHSLKWVFLNACSTKGHVEELHKADVPVVIYTSRQVKDKVAREVARSFYQYLGEGESLKASFGKYHRSQKLKETQEGLRVRDFYRPESNPSPERDYPWEISIASGSEQQGNWGLGDDNPGLFLSRIPRNLSLPPSIPFRKLQKFGSEHAIIFSGRDTETLKLLRTIKGEIFAPTILLYGQSGVGKSSFLEAGIIPYLEYDCEVLYCRRDREKGLLQTVKESLNTQIWDIPSKELGTENEVKQKPIILFVDQIEEVYTRPNNHFQRELSEFLLELKQIYAEVNSNFKRLSCVLCSRKEYFAELRKEVRTHGLPHEDFFLERLDKKGILEAIMCITSEKRKIGVFSLKDKYGVEIKPGLPDIIADDLEEDRNSAIAPVLQLILDKMWHEVEDAPKREFTIELYQRLKREGILMQDFLSSIIQQLSEWNQEAVESGLLLDLLMFHTTPISTADQKSVDEIRERYAHRQDILDELLKEVGASYLLTDLESRNSDHQTKKLAHDILAPLIRQRYEASTAKGQRAERLLSSVRKEYLEDPENVRLDKASLQLIEEGRPGMRIWSVEEEELVRVSWELEKKKGRNRKRIRRGFMAAGIAILGLLVFGVFQNNRARNIEQSNALALQAQLMVDQDPTQAIQLLQKSLAIHSQKENEILLSEYKRIFPQYELVGRMDGEVQAAAMNPDGNQLVVALSQKHMPEAFPYPVHLYKLNSLKSLSDPIPLQGIANSTVDIHLSADGQIFVSSHDNHVHIFDYLGRRENPSTYPGEVTPSKVAISNHPPLIAIARDNRLQLEIYHRDSSNRIPVEHISLAANVSALGINRSKVIWADPYGISSWDWKHKATDINLMDTVSNISLITTHEIHNQMFLGQYRRTRVPGWRRWPKPHQKTHAPGRNCNCSFFW